MYGLYNVARNYLIPPLVGVYRHFLRPRRNLLARYGSNWALVSGGSDGIGEALAYELASEGFNIVLLARTQEKLEAVAKNIKDRYNKDTRIVTFDHSKLFNEEGYKQLFEKLDSLDVEVSVLVNTAGKAHMNPFHKHTIEMCLFMINVNINSMVALCHYYSEKFLKRCEESGKTKRSAIINYSSVAAYHVYETGNLPMAGVSMYSATKSFNRLFSNSIEQDYYNQGIDVLTVCPRGVKSGMNSGRYTDTITSEQHASSVIDKLGWDSETEGHWRHYTHAILKRFYPTGYIINSINAKRRQEFLKERDEQERLKQLQAQQQNNQ
eukprot:403342553